jgi:antitoxin (DNA-binding transcriptional repressor) of toxin-antitoxin stability system
MYEATVEEAKQRLPDLLKAAMRGEMVYITFDNDQSVRLVPRVSPKVRRQFGSAKGLIQMRDNFDAPLEDFQDYTT